MTMVEDAAVAYVTSRCQMALVGAEAVAESGGIINKTGTCAAATAPRATRRRRRRAASPAPRDGASVAPQVPDGHRGGRVQEALLRRVRVDEIRADVPALAARPAEDGAGEARSPAPRRRVAALGSIRHPAPTSRTPLHAQERSHAAFVGRDPPAELALETPSRDYTPPCYITMLFTDLGVLTPSAVSDELIKLFD